MTEPNDARHLELIAAAQRQWIDALTDLGGRNTLLYYKDRRAGTLDLANADPEALERFEKTGGSRLTRLFTDADIRADAIHRMQTIYRKARELTEERGIRAGYLATGLARWDELFLEPAAPVLLRGLTITPTRARYDDFDLTLDDEVEVNPVLLHKLASVFGAVIEKPSQERIAAQLAKAAAQRRDSGFSIEKRKVIGTFTYAKLPMVRDLEAAGDLLADSELVAAIAGDAYAQQLVAAEPDRDRELGRRQGQGVDAPEDDYSVLDADSSQRSAIDSVVAGRSLVIHGPPGTGKSQTIANLVAAMVARGRKVLFVAEKRAAIDAVLSRLVGVNLGDTRPRPHRRSCPVGRRGGELGLPDAAAFSYLRTDPADSGPHTAAPGGPTRSGVPRAARAAPRGAGGMGGLAQREVRRRRPGRAAAAVRLPRASAGMGRVRAAADGASGACPAGRPRGCAGGGDGGPGGRPGDAVEAAPTAGTGRRFRRARARPAARRGGR